MERKEVYISSKRQPHQRHSTDDFLSFRHLEGKEIDLVIGNWRTRMPRRTVFLKDYPETILIEMYFDYGSYKELIQKAALAVGDIKIKEIREVFK